MIRQLPLYHSLLVDHHGEPDHRLHGRRHDQAGIGRCGEAKVCVSLFILRGVVFSLVQFVAFFGPLIGLVLGFDAINRERNEGTLSKLLVLP